jgi:hypothetical protein
LLLITMLCMWIVQGGGSSFSFTTSTIPESKFVSMFQNLSISSVPTMEDSTIVLIV